MKLCTNFFNDTELQVLQEATIEVLEKTGIQFNNEKALDVFKKHGARIDGNVVFISRQLLENSLKNAPRHFTVYGRNENYDAEIGNGVVALAPASGPVYIRRDGKKKLANSKDYLDLIKLTESSDVVNFNNYIVVEPQDIPEERRKMHQVALSLKLSGKPLVGMTMGKGLSEKAIKLVTDFYGEVAKPRMIGIISPISPLIYDEEMIENIFTYAKNGQPLMVAACSQPGATSPVTLAGTLVVDNAEVLAGIVLSQLITPGLPVIYGITSASCDLRYVSPAIGSPETAIITMTASALAHSYGLPCRSGGTLTDSKCLDMQTGIEATMTFMPAIMSGVDFILHAVGVMDSFNTVSLEKFLIDEDIAKSCIRIQKGYELGAEQLAVELISKLGHGGGYIKQKHTKSNFKSELHSPLLFSREGYERWESSGSLDIEERAKLAVNKRIDDFKETSIEPEREKLLSEFFYNIT